MSECVTGADLVLVGLVGFGVGIFMLFWMEDRQQREKRDRED